MKTFKTLDDLKQMALKQGAAVEVGATRYNTKGQKVTTIERKTPPSPVQMFEPKPEPKPEPVAEPAKVEVDMSPVAQSQERMAQMLAQALASLPQPAAPVREWVFTVERDSNGLLTSISAKAQS